MGAISIDYQKKELAKQIMDEKSRKAVFPCQMTIEELEEEVKQSMFQYDRGETKTHEEFFKELRTW